MRTRGAVWIVGLLATAALAGCIGDDLTDADSPDPDQPEPLTLRFSDAPFGTLLCTDGYLDARAVGIGVVDRCNHRVTLPLSDPGVLDVASQHGPGNEVSIAVNPLNPLNLIGGAKDYSVSYVSDVAGCGNYTVWMGQFWSYDGGLTWGNDLMRGFPGDPRPSPLHGNACNTDPVMAFDDDGTAWFHALNYDGAREDASVVQSPFSSHDLVSGSQLYFARSDTGGDEYTQITFSSIGDDDTLFNDKNWFALQPGGDHMMATWTLFSTVPGGAGGRSSIMFTESFDDGLTWTAPEEIVNPVPGPTPSIQFSMPQYLPASASGDIAVIWADYTQSGVRGGSGAQATAALVYVEGTITPGGSQFGAPADAFQMHPLKSGSGRDGTGPSKFRVSTYPVLAVDTSGGDHDGRRYVVWSDQPGALDSDVQVLLSWSDDGVAWSDAMPVNDVADGDQLMPWIDVDPDGGVHVMWYDRRNDPENRLLDVYYAYSDTGAESFYPNVRVTETSFDGDLGHHQNGSPFIGDYNGMDTTNESAHLFWADTRHTGQPGRLTGSDVYSATILRGETARHVFDAAFDA